MIRLILDTNILVSSQLNPLGWEAKLVALVLAGLLRIHVTEAMFREYSRVLLRPKFHLNRLAVEELLVNIRRLASWHEPDRRVSASPDESDNRFLECAEVAGADFLVTGNTKHFPRHWKRTRIVTTREFFALYSQAEGAD
jgi:uncharacterized protein